jgi:hypothetical protein
MRFSLNTLSCAPSPVGGYGIREFDSVIGADDTCCQESRRGDL